MRLRSVRSSLTVAAFVLGAAAFSCRTATPQAPTSRVLDAANGASAAPAGIDFYEASRIRGLAPTASCAAFRPKQGITVTQRDAAGAATQGTIRVLVDNPGSKVYIAADFNKWGAEKTEADRLQPVAGEGQYFEGRFRSLKHLMQYRLLVDGKQLIDPAATMFTTPEFFATNGLTPDAPYLNSVFWDAERPQRYTMTTTSVDLREAPIIIAESEVYELSRKWKAAGGQGPKQRGETYRFVAQSGLVDELRKAGYNAVEFLPFNTSMDGDPWHFRYQIFGLYGPDSRYGSPDDFAMMIDAFNKAGIGVIMDAVVGHYPLKGNEGVREISAFGLHQWKKADGQALYGQHPSPWGTNRYDYASPYIRRFLTDSVLNMMCRYGLTGIRFDNLDGIKDYDGPGGGAAGTAFLKMLVKELRAYRPESILIGEMFFGNNNVMRRFDPTAAESPGFGFNFRTHSDFFDFLKDNMLLPTEQIDMAKLRAAVRGPWEWKEAPRVQYVTNHDEAANKRDGATGAYLASLVNGGGWYYVEKKTQAFGSLTMLSSSAYLDMPQLRLLQEGNFNDNSAVDWSLRDLDSQRKIYGYFADLSNIVKARPAFAFLNYDGEVENHVDIFSGWRIMSIYRHDRASGKKYYGVVNLGHVGVQNYAFGVNATGNFKALINSDNMKYGGSGELEKRLPTGVVKADGGPLHGKEHSLTVPYLAPYTAVLFESQ